jgi:hypothetical protein
VGFIVRTMLRFVIEGDKIKDLEIIEIEKGVTKLCAKWDFRYIDVPAFSLDFITSPFHIGGLYLI